MILTGFGLSFYSYNQFRTDRQLVEHTYEVENTLAEVLSLTKDVETAVRGYLIADDRTYLAPYTQARPQLLPKLGYLSRLVADSPVQQRLVDSLYRLLEVKLVMDRRQLAARARHRTGDLISLLANGKAQMDTIRRHIAGMRTTEERLLKSRIRKAEDSYRLSFIIGLSLLILTLFSLVVSYWLLMQELDRRQYNEDQLRAYEAELQANIQQLKDSNEELERFAFVASHDLQEPLRKIQTYADLLGQRYQTTLGDEARSFLSKINTSAGRMSHMVKDLLGFSRLSSQLIDFQPVLLVDVVTRIMADLELQIDQTGATVTVGTLPTVEAVPGHIDHLFGNLLDNALKFSRPGVPPVVEIKARPVTDQDYPGLPPERAYVEITVADNGIGFDEKYLTHIFDVFQRLHAKADYDGTGIGLAVCRKVVQQHRGLITARSQPGNGATFVVVLPKSQT
jgi:signal transduction histidine kinase